MLKEKVPLTGFEPVTIVLADVQITNLSLYPLSYKGVQKANLSWPDDRKTISGWFFETSFNFPRLTPDRSTKQTFPPRPHGVDLFLTSRN